MTLNFSSTAQPESLNRSLKEKHLKLPKQKDMSITIHNLTTLTPFHLG